jgi:5-methyltetrahydrofolate--homocysteine methyltransferase
MDFNGLLKRAPLIVGDGAMGTELMARGLPAGHCGELWNVERPDIVQDVQSRYVEAGADYLLTNTFGANPIALARHGLADRTEELNRRGVEIARRAAGQSVIVIGDMSSTGMLLDPYGPLSEALAREAFARQAAALAGAGADAIICETFGSAAEMRVALQGARDACALPLVASMTFSPEPGGRYRSLMGEGPEALVRTAHECGCAVVGTNCGQGIRTMPQLVGEITALTDLPVIVQPNAGLPRLVDGLALFEEDPKVFDEYVPALYEAGARLIGGCDGTTAEHVRVIRRFADGL